MTIARTRTEHWLTPDAGDLDTFITQVSQQVNLPDWPFAEAVEQNVLIYAGDDVRQAGSQPSTRQALMREWATAFLSGPGIIAIKGAITADNVIDEATQIFDDIINTQRQNGGGSGDHFAKPGANDRIWNSLEKHCVADPANFAHYYSNDCLAMVSHSWLGRGYQVTAQVNRVNPGGAAQSAHRDYHLGFMNADQLMAFPEHVHLFSSMLTLQGAIAHCDMPLESGPTLYLPYSHQFREGYVAFQREEFQQYFREHRAQLPLRKGDMVFFNPALMHAAGENQSNDIYRMANLLQVSSAFGRPIEHVNHLRMLEALYPELLRCSENRLFSEQGLLNLVASATQGYAFPTNLDTDPPIGGLAPQSQYELVIDSLDRKLSHDAFIEQIQAQQSRKR